MASKVTKMCLRVLCVRHSCLDFPGEETLTRSSGSTRGGTVGTVPASIKTVAPWVMTTVAPSVMMTVAPWVMTNPAGCEAVESRSSSSRSCTGRRSRRPSLPLGPLPPSSPPPPPPPDTSGAAMLAAMDQFVRIQICELHVIIHSLTYHMRAFIW